MKLSTAILKGAEQRPQCYHAFFGAAGEASCVLGAAMEGVFGVDALAGGGSRFFATGLQSRFPVLRRATGCPACWPVRNTVVWDILMHLNDAHRWSRELIAAWVDGLEEGGHQ